MACSMQARAGAFMSPDFNRILQDRSRFYVHLRTEQRLKAAFHRRFQHFATENRDKVGDVIENSMGFEWQTVQKIGNFIPDSKNLQEAIEKGLGPTLMQAISERNSQLMPNFIYNLGLITSEPLSHSQIMAYRDLLPALIDLITPEAGHTASFSMWVISNLSTFSQEISESVVQLGLLSRLIALLQSPLLPDYRGVTWTLMHVLVHFPCKSGTFHEDWLRALLSLQIRTPDIAISTDILFITAIICGKDENLVGVLLENDYGGWVVQLVSHSHPEVSVAALKVVCVIAESTSFGALLQWGVLETLVDRLKCETDRVVLESLRALIGVFTVPNRAITKRVVSLSLVPILLRLIRTAKHQIALRSLTTLCNLLQDRFWLLSHSLLEHSAVPTLLTVLRDRHYEEVEKALEVLKVLLEVTTEMSLEQGENQALEELRESGGEEVLERLYGSANGEIAQLALVILERYFSPVEEEEPGEMDAFSMIEQYDF